MNNRIRTGFLEAQEREGRALEAASDIFSLETLGPSPHQRFVARFELRTVVLADGAPREADGVCAVGIWLAPEYHLRVVVPQVLTFLGPRELFHPNVKGPFVCLGDLVPGTPLAELVFRIHAVLSYRNYGLRRPLNGAAAAWARRNLDRFPTDTRPLKRRAGKFDTQVRERNGAA